jgi:hypothetical protein
MKKTYVTLDKWLLSWGILWGNLPLWNNLYFSTAVVMNQRGQWREITSDREKHQVFKVICSEFRQFTLISKKISSNGISLISLSVSSKCRLMFPIEKKRNFKRVVAYSVRAVFSSVVCLIKNNCLVVYRHKLYQRFSNSVSPPPRRGGAVGAFGGGVSCLYKRHIYFERNMDERYNIYIGRRSVCFKYKYCFIL